MEPVEDIRQIFKTHRQGTTEVIQDMKAVGPKRDEPATKGDIDNLTMIVQAGFTGTEDALIYIAQQIEMLRADLKSLQDAPRS